MHQASHQRPRHGPHLQVGQSLFLDSHSARHSPQKAWPHGTMA